MRSFNILCVCVCLASSLSQAAERPTLLKTCDPRPDILPRPYYDNHTEYRAQYNRPRFYTGWLAYEVSRTSQEAMVWQENYCAGNYDQHHMPPVCKTYYYPKPWEVLNAGARPDFAAVKPKTQRVPPVTQSEVSEKSELKAQDESSSKDSEDKADDEKAPVKAAEVDKSEAKPVEEIKREVVPSPSDKTSSRSSTTTKQKPVSTKPSPSKPSPAKPNSVKSTSKKAS